MPAPVDVRQAPPDSDPGPATTSRLARSVDALLRAWATDSEDSLFALQVMIGRALSARADFSRADSPWPTPVPGAAGLGLAHGAAGIIHTLRECSLDLDPQADQWLADAVSSPAQPDATPAGLFDGLAGVAWVLRRQGRVSLADDVRDSLLSQNLERLGSDLYGGLPGIGLFLLAEPGRSPVLLNHVDHLSRTLNARRAGGTARPAGLLWGEAGAALFELRLYRSGGDPVHLERAQAALDAALGACVRDPDGSLLALDAAGRPGVGLAHGSSGIGLVLVEYLRLLPEHDRYVAALDGLRVAACRREVTGVGVFDGLAGVVHFLVALVRSGLDTPEVTEALETRVNAFAAHAVRLGTGIAFRRGGGPAFDLATGAAGVLGALQAYCMARFDDGREGWDGLLPLLPG